MTPVPTIVGLILSKPRPPRPDELPEIRAAWWRLRRIYGVALPAEPGTILIDGGRR